jgi:hypothetical protein
VPAARKATCSTTGERCAVGEPGSPALAIPAITASYNSLITDAAAGLGEALVLEYASASAFHLNNCH